MFAIVLFLFPIEQSIGQQQSTVASNSKEGTITPQFPNTPVPTILLEYERITGKTVVRDASIQDKTLIIQSSKEMTYAEAASFIEKSFLLNGYGWGEALDAVHIRLAHKLQELAGVGG